MDFQEATLPVYVLTSCHQ